MCYQNSMKRASCALKSFFTPEEGRLGVVVTFIALLELCRDDMLLIVQTEPFAPIHIKRAA